MSTEPTEIPETIPLEPVAPLTVEGFNSATVTPDAMSETHATQPAGQHVYLFAGDGDSLGSLNAVLNKLKAESVPVLDVRRVWAVKCMATLPSTGETSQAPAEEQTPEGAK